MKFKVGDRAQLIHAYVSRDVEITEVDETAQIYRVDRFYEDLDPPEWIPSSMTWSESELTGLPKEYDENYMPS